MIIDLNFSWNSFENFKPIYERKKENSKSEKKLSPEL